MSQPEVEREGGGRSRTLLLLGGTVILAIAALIAYASFSGREEANGDRLPETGLATGPDSSPERRCASQAVYDLIKRELFRRAAEARGGDAAAFGTLAAYSAVRMESPLVVGEDEETHAVTCSGRLWLDLPPGVVTASRKSSLGADIGYVVQLAADGSGEVVRIDNGSAIVSPLATLARVRQSREPPADPEPPEPSDPLAPLGEEPESREEPSPEPVQPQASANPSFDCDAARTRSEIAVCRDPGLAELDRQMAARFNSALGRAEADQRRLLLQTRSRFLSFRERCSTDRCIADTYRGRMREIADIMAGRWQPPR